MNNEILQEIKKVLEKRLKNYNYKAFLYGSRARWDFNFRSDYDIWVILDKKLDILIKDQILEDFEHIPALIDFTDFSQVSKEFKRIATKDIIWIKK